ncbi:unnamed protein product [Heterosigma akashiwo]
MVTTREITGQGPEPTNMILGEPLFFYVHFNDGVVNNDDLCVYAVKLLHFCVFVSLCKFFLCNFFIVTNLSFFFVLVAYCCYSVGCLCTTKTIITFLCFFLSL